MLEKLRQEGFVPWTHLYGISIDETFHVLVNGDKRIIVDMRRETTGEYETPPLLVPYYEHQVPYPYSENIHYAYLWVMLERRFIVSLEQSMQLRIVRHYTSRYGANIPDAKEKDLVLAMLHAELRRLIRAPYNKNIRTTEDIIPYIIE
jgi:hypothetical protein